MSLPRIEIYSWGANSHGQTGTNLPDAEELHHPTLVQATGELLHHLAAAAAAAAAAATAGLSPSLAAATTAGGSTVGPPGGAGVSVTGGGGHSVLLVNGRVFTAGLNDTGQLGRPTDRAAAAAAAADAAANADGVFRPAHVAEPVVSAACGWDHTLLLTSSGHLLTAGGNRFGQRGSAPAAAAFVPLSLDGLMMSSDLQVMSSEDGTVSLQEDKAVKSTESAVASQNVSVTSQESAAVMLHDKVTSEDVSVTSLPPPGWRIATVSAGLRHSAAVTADGRLLVWGDNSRCQLGVPGQRLVPSPRLLPTPAPVVSVACGQRHTVLLCRKTTGKRQLYGMGDNRRGQLLGKITPSPGGSSLVPGDVTPAQLDGPSLVELPGDVTPARVHCGWTHTIVECGDGRALGWGRSDYGQLRLPPDRLGRLASGSEHGLALTQTGHLLAWGWNEHGAAAGHMTSSVMTSAGYDEKVPVSLEMAAVVSERKTTEKTGLAEDEPLKTSEKLLMTSESMMAVTSESKTSVSSENKTSVTSGNKMAVTSGNMTSVTSEKVTSMSERLTEHSAATSQESTAPSSDDNSPVTSHDVSMTSQPGVADVTRLLPGRVIGVGAGYGCSFAICLIEKEKEKEL